MQKLNLSKTILFLILILAGHHCWAISYIHLFIVHDGFATQVRMPEKHDFTQDILQLLKQKGFSIQDVEVQQAFNKPSATKDQDETFIILHNGVSNFTVPSRQAYVHNLSDNSPAQSEVDYGDSSTRFHSLTGQWQCLRVSAAEAESVSKQLMIDESSSSSYKWLIVKTQNAPDQKSPPDILTVHPFYYVYDDEDHQDCNIIEVTNDDWKKIKDKCHVNPLPDVSLRANKPALAHFYTHLMAMPDTVTKNTLQIAKEREREREQAKSEIREILPRLSSLNLFTWGYFAGLPWGGAMSNYSQNMVHDKRPDSEEMVAALVGLPRVLVKTALKKAEPGADSFLSGPILDDFTYQTLLDRFTVQSMGKVPSGFVSRTTLSKFGFGVSDSNMSNSLIYLNAIYPDGTYRLISNSDQRKMHKSHCFLALFERIRNEGANIHGLLTDLFERNYPIYLPKEPEVQQRHRQLTQWLDPAPVGQLFMIPRGLPQESVYQFRLLEQGHDIKIHSQSVSSTFASVSSPQHPQETLTARLWSAEISAEEREKEIDLLQTMDKADPRRIRPVFVPRYEGILTYGNPDDEGGHAGLAIPQVLSSIEEILSQKGFDDHIPLIQKVEIIAQITSGLAWLHKQNFSLSRVEDGHVLTNINAADIRLTHKWQPVCTSLQFAQSMAFGTNKYTVFINEAGETYPEPFTLKELDGLALARFIVELITEAPVNSYQQALRATEEHMSHEGDTEIPEFMALQKLYTLACSGLQGTPYNFSLLTQELGTLKKVLSLMPRLTVPPKPEGTPLLPSAATIPMTMAEATHTSQGRLYKTLEVNTTCSVCLDYFSSDDRAHNAMRFNLANNTLSKIYCRQCAQRLMDEGAPDPHTRQRIISMLRDQSGIEQISTQFQQEQLEAERVKQMQESVAEKNKEQPSSDPAASVTSGMRSLTVAPPVRSVPSQDSNWFRSFLSVFSRSNK